jgi:protein TonB
LSPPRIFRMDSPPRTVPTTPVLISDDFIPSAASFSNALTIGIPTNLGPLVVSPAIAPPPARPVTEPAKAPEKPHAVGGDVQAAKLIKKVIPAYPALAKQARISGTVRLVGVIARDGTIEQLQVVSGHPLLVGTAVDAVRQWVYRPTLLNGVAVEVIAPIDVIFTLAQ